MAPSLTRSSRDPSPAPPRDPSPALPFAFRLDADVLEAVRVIAKERGMGPTQLVRAWVIDRVRLEREAGLLKLPTTSDYPSDFEHFLRRKVVDLLMSKLADLANAAVESITEQMDHEAALKAEALVEAAS